MNDNREHPSFEELNDFVDGQLDNHAARQISEHLNRCSACRAEHEQLSGLLSLASETHLAVDPDQNLWNDVKRAIEIRKEVALRVADDAPGVSAPERMRVSPAILAAAAVILIVLSSGITTLVLRTSDTRVAAVLPIDSSAKILLPASFQATEDEYARTIRELRIAVDAQRGNLSPETIRTVDRSLAVVDSAIAEARAALVEDPNNRTLVDLLASSYQRKLDLLRRTSELSPKI